MDVDRAAGMCLRRRFPRATVSICDALSSDGLTRSKVWNHRDHVDVVVANPPFGSLNGPRLVSVQGWTSEVKCGVAAAHLLSAARWFSPRELLALVPDSMLHSERDVCAMRAFESQYSIEVLRTLGTSGFERTAASVSLIRMRRVSCPRGAREPSGPDECPQKDIGPVRLVRGGVSMHDAEEVEDDGLPLLHTTNLLGRGSNRLVKPRGRGIVSGPAVLLPRVGLPCRRHLEPANLSRHQLSDCVLALLCQSEGMASILSERLQASFEALLRCWGGTGAQYTTIRKVAGYLGSVGVAVDISAVRLGE